MLLMSGTVYIYLKQNLPTVVSLKSAAVHPTVGIKLAVTAVYLPMLRLLISFYQPSVFGPQL